MNNTELIARVSELEIENLRLFELNGGYLQVIQKLERELKRCMADWEIAATKNYNDKLQIEDLERELKELKLAAAHAWHQTTGETYPVIGRDGKLRHWYTFRPTGDSSLNSGPAPLWRVLLFKIGIVRVKWFSDRYKDTRNE